MDQAAFKQAMLYMFTDVRREVALAKASATPAGEATLNGLGVQPGGGNLMAALALLCYTEFGGQLKHNLGGSRLNFDAFFKNLGPVYQAFYVAHPKVYDIFRCGLAHEYFVKKDCDIYIASGGGKPGIGFEGGRYFFVVETYCDDLQKAFEALEKALYPPPPAGGPKAVPVQVVVQTLQGPPVTTSGYIPPTQPILPTPPPTPPKKK